MGEPNDEKMDETISQLDTDTQPMVGDRIKLVTTDDPYTRLKSGDEGTVTFVGPEQDGGIQIGVKWDMESRLSMIIPTDEIEIIE